MIKNNKSKLFIFTKVENSITLVDPRVISIDQLQTTGVGKLNLYSQLTKVFEQMYKFKVLDV